MTTGRVVVVGGGISGIACACELHDAGLEVRVVERSNRLGGRMAVRTEHLPSGPHPVDIGASYFTVRDPLFAGVVERWRGRGLAHEWTDTFLLATPDGRLGTTTSPTRWSGSQGLRRLVEDLAEELDVQLRRHVQEVSLAADGTPLVDGEPVAAAVLAMPDPQAADLLPPEPAADLGVRGRSWTPALAVWAVWPERWWRPFDGMFVDDSVVLSWVADDGRRRGDDAPVLVAHTTAAFAEERMDDPRSAIAAVLRELPGVLGSGPMPDPVSARVHRWAMASPRHPRHSSFGLHPSGIGVCGDGWGARPRVEQAWLSGYWLGRALVERLTRVQTALGPG